MIRFVLARLGQLALTLLAASLVIFGILEGLPGDVAAFMMGLNADPAAVSALRESLGLDAPFALRYVHWVTGMLTGDFGLSYTYKVPVAGLIAAALTVSLPLALLAFGLTLALALPLALWLARRTDSAAGTLVLAATQIGVAVPNFWLGLMLMWLFAIQLPLFSAGGFAGWSAGPGPALASLVLPALALALPQAAILTRVLRAALIEALGADYIRTARAKGLSQAQVLRRHALRNALIPALPIIGLQLAFLVAGAIIVETVFYLQGIGRLIFQAISQRDLITVRGATMVLVALVVCVMFIVDVLAAALDPRQQRLRP